MRCSSRSGLAAAAVAFQIPMRAWQKLAPWLFIAGVVLLVLVLVPGIGKSVNGSRRWLSLAVFNVQPSEFMKLAVVLYAASYAVRRAAFLHAEQPLRQTILRGFLPLFAVMVVTGGLLLLEPDFGAFVVIVAIAFGILFLGGLDWRLFLGLALLLPVALAGDPRRRAVPPAAADGVPRPVVGSARQGLPALAFADRVRPRRVVRRRPGVERGEAPVPARGAHRLPARGDRGGTGLRRRRAS